MHKILILYNVHSGTQRAHRLTEIQKVITVFRGPGCEVIAEPTSGRLNTLQQVKRGIQTGCEAVIACGGDGTIHDVVQGLVGTKVPLGIIPFGTANALAHDLKIPFTSIAAAIVAMQAQRKRVAVGSVQYIDFDGNKATRFFVVVAGIGENARIFYSLTESSKERLGRWAYYLMAWRLWLKSEKGRFISAWNGCDEEHLVRDLLAVRIGTFGGFLRELVPESSLERNDLRLTFFHTRNRLSYLLYMIRASLGANVQVPGSQWVNCLAVRSWYSPNEGGGKTIYVGADGELLGTLPATITIVRDALTLLVPNSG